MHKPRFALPSRKTIILLLVVLWLILALAISISNLSKPKLGSASLTNMKAYGDEHMGFSIKYPEDWNAFQTPQGSHGDQDVIAVILVPGKSFPQVYIARRDFASANIIDVVTWGESKVKQRSAFAKISAAEVSPGNTKELIRQYHWQDQTYFGPVNIQCEDLYAMEGSIGYDLSFCAEQNDWERFVPVIQAMMHSFAMYPGG